MASKFLHKGDQIVELSENITSKLYHNIVMLQECPEDPDKSIRLELEDDITVTAALKQIIKRFIPSSLALFVEYGILLSNIIFIGTLGESVLLSGVGLGVFTINMVVFWVDVGLCGGLDTLVSQSYGRKDYYACGVYLNAARIMIAVLFIPQTLMILNIRSFYVLLNQPPQSAELASQYAVLLLPGVFLGMQFE